jgi:1,4-dihydroxy-2-naphthoyl-CoA hydrolase
MSTSEPVPDWGGDNPFPEHLGFKVVKASRDEVIVEALLKREYCTVGDRAHGGFLMSLADYTGAVAGFLNLPEGANGTTTTESKTNMVGACPAGTKLRATARPVHVGRRTSVWLTRVETEAGKLLSLTSQTQMVL